ncbi:Uncharacterized protein GBIM_06031 [Gryllus bimaculatus]|nr:Uncharacterized protein GBIM_06031 [Gryllus bimaculatus]
MARQSGCTFLGTSDEVEDIVDDLCSDILIDTELIERLDFPIYARDVFCEQVALCGIEGFVEFMRPAWIKQILSWQRPVGCFGNEVEFREAVEKVKYERRRRKRDDGVMAHGCLMHFTGVALAALAASLRYLAENGVVNAVFLT